MTFDANQPNASQSPGLFPAGGNVNNARLKTLINAEHVFNDTGQADDGVHRQMTMVARADPVSLPTGTSSMLYTKLVAATPKLYFYDGSVSHEIGNVSSVTIAARISWNSSGTAIGTPFNATVSYSPSSGAYTVTFPSPLSSNTLQFSLFAIDSSNNLVIPKITSYTQNLMRMVMKNQNNTTHTAAGYLIVFGE